MAIHYRGFFMSDILLPDGTILHDADTPKVEGERRRLTFGDAPEVANPVKGTPAEAGGEAATDAVAWALSNGYSVRDTGGEDIHGRKLATIAPDAGGPDLQNDLIAAGAMDPSHWKSIDDGGRSMDALTAPGARGLTGIDNPSPMAKDENFQFLADKARNERLADLQRRIDTGMLGRATNNMPGRDPRDDKDYGTFAPAFERGVDNMQSTFYGFADALGSAAGIDLLSEWGQDGVAVNVVEAMRNPARVESWEDIDGFADAMTYALEAVGEFAPQLLTDIAAGAATGGTAVLGKEALAMGGKALLRRAGTQAVAAPRKVGAAGWEAFAPAAKGGAFTSAYMQNAGETQNQFQAEGIDAPGQALAIGVGKAALDYAGLDVTLRQAFKGLSKEAAGDPFKLTQWLGRSAAAASVAFSAESVTEGAQTLMDELAIQGHKPDYEVNWSGVVDAMLKGGIGGGVAAGGGHAIASLLNSGSQPAIPGADDPLQDTAPEPFGDIIAQVKSTPQGEGNWYTSQNAEQAKQAAAEAGKSFRELPDGSVAVGTDDVLAQLGEQPTQADIARLNGYAQTKDEALADPQGAVVVETRDANGAVLRNQIVGAQIADAIRAQQESKFPGAQTVITSAEKAVASRQQAVDLESRLDSKDPSAALAEANALGIDLAQFQADKLGPAMLERLTVGLRAKLDPSQVREGGNNRRLNDVSALAEVLDLPAEQLKVEFHNDSRNIIRARDQLLQLVESRAQEKFGSVEGLAKAVNELPRRKAEAIRTALGLGDDAVGGFDMPGLLSAIRARKPSDTQTPPSPLDEPVVAERQGGKPRPDQGGRLHELVMGQPLLRDLVTNGDGSRARTGEIAERLRTLSSGDRVRLEQMFKQLELGEGGARRADFLELLGEVAVGPVTHDIGSRFVDDTEASDESGARIVEPATEFQPSILDSRAARLLGELRSTPIDKKGPNGEPVGLIKHLEALSHIVGTVQEEQDAESALTDREAAQLRRVALAAQTVKLLAKELPGTFAGDRLAQLHADVAQRLEAGDLLNKAAGRPVLPAPVMERLGEVQDQRVAKALLTMVARLEYPEALSDAVALKLMLSAVERNPETMAAIIAHRFTAFGDGTLANVGGLLAMYEEIRSKERGTRGKERVLSADAGSSDQGVMNLVAVDHDLANENEQEASDKAFFGYVTRSALQAWDAAVLPTAEQLPGVKFPSGESQARTEALAGKNLLALPTYSGSLFGRVVDAVALSHYAQAGEHAPQSTGDALGYFLSNLGRIVAGGQSSHDPLAGAPRAFLRTIPDELVIFVKDNGEPVTLGEALAEQRRGAKGNGALVEAQRRLDALTDEIDARAEGLSGAVEQLDALAENPAATDVVREAIAQWKAVLAGETYSVDGRTVYARGPHRSIGDGSRYFGAYEKIGNVLQVDGKPLHAAHKELLAMLGERKRLAAEAKRLRAERDQQGRQPPVESAAKRESFPEGQEGVEAEDRSYPRALDNEQVEFDPYLDSYDPLGGLTAANRLEALAALAREGRKDVMRRTAGSQLAPATSEVPARPKKAPDRIFDARFRDLVNQLRKQGVPLPSMVLLVEGKQSIAEQIEALSMPPADAQRMLEASLSGDSFYFLGADGTAYIGIANKGSRDRQMLDLTHELGHAVKDQVWADLLGEHRAALAEGFRADLGFDPQNDDQMHEWFADQFSRAVLEHRDAVVRQDAGLIDRALQALLSRLAKLWETLMGTPAGMNPAFRAFATSLFDGDYAQAGREAVASGVVRNASGTEREQRRMTKLPSKTGPIWQSADGRVMIRGRKRIEAGDREFENGEAVLPMGHAAWLEEGNSFWRIDLFAKGEYGVLQKAGHGIFQLSDSDGSVKAIHDIKVYTKRQGHGEQLVASILASGQPLRIIEAISEAQPFWDRMGALGGYDHYNNTWLTWGDYVRAKQSGRADQQRGAEQPGDLGSPLRGNGSDAADSGREGRSGDGDGRSQASAGGVGEQAPLDAESLAFLEAFLGDKPKVRNASGIDQLRALRGRNQVLQTQAKAFWAKGLGAAKHLAPVFSMAYSRISRIDAGLARALFQPANQRQSALGQSWEQRSRALKGRLLAQVDRQLSEFHKEFSGDRSQREAQIQAAFVDAYTGKPQTAAGRKVQALTNLIATEAAKAGLRSVDLSTLVDMSVLGFGHVGPVVFDRRAVASRVSEFQKLVANALKVDDAEAHEIVGRIVDGPGHLEGAIAPGSPVGMHRTNRDLVEALGYDALRDGGWLLERHAEALFHWVDGLSKRAAWEALFGGMDKGDFNPNHRFIQKLEAIRSAKGEGAAREVLALVNGALGRHPAGESMPNWWRNTQEFITGWVGMTVLAFSGVASIPELALPLVRAGGRVGFRESFQDLGEARRFARDMGIVLSDASEQVMWQATGDQYRSPMISKMQSWFFRLNGNEHIVRASRTLATGIGIRYLLQAAAAQDEASLARLNIDAKTVLAWDAAGRPTWSPEQAADVQELAAAVTGAVSQFVNEATLNPSRFQATHWGNNPYMKMIWHLKHFLYTYGDTVLLGMYREMRRRWGHLDARQFQNAVSIAAPALIFAVAVMPLAMASLELRDWMRRLNGQSGKEYEGTLEYFQAVFDRAGGLGPIDFVLNLREQQEQGRSIWGTISPTMGKVDQLLGGGSAEAKVRAMTPVWSQNKTLFGLLE